MFKGLSCLIYKKSSSLVKLFKSKEDGDGQWERLIKTTLT